MRDTSVRSRSERGMSLVEIMVSLAILSFLALSMISMFTTAAHLDKLAQERSVATSLASERVMKIAALPYAPVSDVGNYLLSEETLDAGPPTTLTADYGDLPDYPDYKRVVEITYDSPSPGMIAVKATVTWNHIGQGERSHDMITFIQQGL